MVIKMCQFLASLNSTDDSHKLLSSDNWTELNTLEHNSLWKTCQCRKNSMQKYAESVRNRIAQCPTAKLFEQLMLMELDKYLKLVLEEIPTVHKNHDSKQIESLNPDPYTHIHILIITATKCVRIFYSVCGRKDKDKSVRKITSNDYTNLYQHAICLSLLIPFCSMLCNFHVHIKKLCTTLFIWKLFCWTCDMPFDFA